MRVLSLGAGVQSSTLLLMACEGSLQIDAAIFADTQWEPRAVYDHLAWLEQQSQAAGIPIYRVTAGNLRADALAGKPESWMPLYALDEGGQRHMLKRQCTTNYKLRPIHRQVRVLLKEHGQRGAELLIGISLDEYLRMKPARVGYLVHSWPLIEQRMSRAQCLAWLYEHGYPRPPKSSCCGCPYRDNAAWRTMRDEAPDDWSDALAFDTAIRTGIRAKGTAFIHRQFVPLNQADIRSEQDRGQLDMFTDECSGLCGV